MNQMNQTTKKIEVEQAIKNHFQEQSIIQAALNVLIEIAEQEVDRLKLHDLNATERILLIEDAINKIKR